MQLEIPLEAVIEAARIAAQAGVRVVLDPAPARELPDELLRNVSLLTQNETEAEMLSGERGAEAAARTLSRRTGAAVIVTLGGDGALLHEGDEAIRLPALRVEPVDTTGAGDALNGILAAELARGAGLQEALRWAMTGASLKTTVAGAQAGLPDRAAIAASLG